VWEALKREIYGVVKSRGSKVPLLREGLLSFLQGQNPKDLNLNLHCCENLKSHKGDSSLN
jgi:hypothetical protein